MRPRGSERDKAYAARREEQWDKVLSPLDSYLEIVQRDHLRAVAEAGRSGPQVPRIPDRK